MDEWKSKPSLLLALDKGQLREKLMHYANAGDADSTGAFLDGLRSVLSRKNRHWLSMCLGALLFEDHIAIAKECFQTKDIDAWCDSNVGHLIANSPNVFAYWATSQNFALIGEELGATTDEGLRLAIVSGASQKPQHQRIYALLKENPCLWACMPIDWVGCEGTPLRQAAQDLGWQHHMLFETMQRYDWNYAVSNWKVVTPYPYSFCMAALVHAMEVADPALESARHERFYQIGHELSMDTKALATDGVLMHILFERAIAIEPILASMSYGPSTDWVSARDAEKQRLGGLVAMHAALGSMGMLVDALGHGVLERSTTVETMPLPPLHDEKELGYV